MKHDRTGPLLDDFYRQYLIQPDAAALTERVCQRYSLATLERLADHSAPMTRRAAVLVLGILGDFDQNPVLGRALSDPDRGVRTLAESGIRALWCRAGTAAERRQLKAVIRLNNGRRFREAVRQASRLLETAPALAEAWNQRALAHFSVGQFDRSIRDCLEALEGNPYHFGAATGMGQCHLQLGDRRSALECFRRALRLNPNLEGVRAHVAYLQQALKNQD